MAGEWYDKRYSAARIEYDLAKEETSKLWLEIRYAARCQRRAEQFRKEMMPFEAELERLEQQLQETSAAASKQYSYLKRLELQRSQFRPNSNEYKDLDRQISRGETEYSPLAKQQNELLERVNDLRPKVETGKFHIADLERVKPPDPARYPEVVSWFRAALNGHE